MTTKKPVEASGELEETESAVAADPTTETAESDQNVAESFAQEITRMRQEWADTKEALRGIIGHEPSARRADAAKETAGPAPQANSGTSESAANEPTTKSIEKRPESGHWYWRKRGG